MKKFHLQSILLGIGMGVVLTSIISMIYIAGVSPDMKMSKQEIIDQAKKYGMIDNTGLVNSTSQPDQKVDSVSLGDSSGTTKSNSTQTPTPDKNAASVQQSPSVEVQVSISQGDTSEIVAAKLLNAGVITDKAAFVKQLSDSGMATQIAIGDYKLKKGSGFSSIIKVITGG